MRVYHRTRSLLSRVLCGSSRDRESHACNAGPTGFTSQQYARAFGHDIPCSCRKCTGQVPRLDLMLSGRRFEGPYRGGPAEGYSAHSDNWVIPHREFGGDYVWNKEEWAWDWKPA